MVFHRFRSRLWRLCHKELKETLRDRRTIVTLLLMPLLVYPILSMALNRFLLASGTTVEGYTVCVRSEAEAERLDQWLSDPRSFPPEAILQASEGEMASFQLTVIPERPVGPLLLRDDIDVLMRIERMDWRIPLVKIYARRGDSRGLAAQRILTERLQWLRLSRAELILERVLPDYNQPMNIEVLQIGQPPKGDLLATIVPLVLVLMTITGAVYPAIDLTAGERERGTMEAVMASPVPRGHVLAKYVAV